ncbi:MAG TPA: hypothetical protein VGM82_01725 [Gemmatimonadaceae bacterium]|jgi:hypothetical protein
MMSFLRRVGFVLLAALPATALAQDAGNGFLFGSPAGAVTLRGGWDVARAGGDLFAFTTSQLTLNRSDFSSPNIGMDVTVHLFGRTSLTVSGDFAGMSKKSEFRNFIDNNNAPIEQITKFRRVPLSVSVKQYLTSPGREVGKFAWIPSRAAFFVGAGGGAQYYKFEQDGDFIDFQNNMDVFHDTFKSDGWAPSAHALAGFDYTLSPRWAITTEARYTWSRADLSNDFSGFKPLDLSGFMTNVGLTVRF